MVLNKDVIERILQIKWLQNCKNSKVVPSLECIRTDGSKAFSKAARTSWDNTRLEARGVVTSYLAVHAPKEFNPYWNPLVRQVRSEVWSKIEMEITESVEKLGLPEIVTESIKFDVINMAVVLSYQDIIRSQFYEDLLDIYCQGLLPCGWEGEYPRGCMVIM